MLGGVLLDFLDLCRVSTFGFAHARVDCMTCQSQRARGQCAEAAGCACDDDDLLHGSLPSCEFVMQNVRFVAVPRSPHTKPPLGRTTWLLIQPPSGPARNDTRFAISSGMPSRSSGFIFFNSSISASLLPFRNRSVRTWPGATALTVMFLPRSSLASTWTIPSTPALEAM